MAAVRSFSACFAIFTPIILARRCWMPLEGSWRFLHNDQDLFRCLLTGSFVQTPTWYYRFGQKRVRMDAQMACQRRWKKKDSALEFCYKMGWLQAEFRASATDPFVTPQPGKAQWRLSGNNCKSAGSCTSAALQPVVNQCWRARLLRNHGKKFKNVKLL